MGGRAFLRAIVIHFMGCDEPEGPSPDGPEPAIEMTVHHRPVRTTAAPGFLAARLVSLPPLIRATRRLGGRFLLLLLLFLLEASVVEVA